MEQTTFRKKAFKKIKYATINEQMDRQERNIDQSLLQTPDPLMVSGVIYAIILQIEYMLGKQLKMLIHVLKGTGINAMKVMDAIYICIDS